MTRNQTVGLYLINKVRETSEKFPQATQNEIGTLCGTSGSTVSKILNGKYDYVISGKKPDAYTDSELQECIQELIEEQKRTNDLLHVIGVVLAHGLLPEESDRNAKCVSLHNLNPELNLGELARRTKGANR